MSFRGRGLCDEKKLHIALTDEQNKFVIEQSKSYLNNLIGVPDVQDKLKIGISNIKIAKKFENERYKEHKKLYDFLNETTEELYYQQNIFVNTSEFPENRTAYIQGVFEQVLKTFPFVDTTKGIYQSGLNNNNLWDAKTIKSVRIYFEKKYTKFKKNKDNAKLSNYQNQIQNPLLLMLDLDPTGKAYKIMLSIQELNDISSSNAYLWKYKGIQKNETNLETIESYLASGVYRKDIDPKYLTQEILEKLENQKINKKITYQIGDKFFNMLVHGDARNIIKSENIPVKPLAFKKWRNSYIGKMFFNYQKLESERQEMGSDGGNYVLIPLHTDVKGKKYLKNIRENQIKNNIISQSTTPDNQYEEAYISIRIPDNFNSFLKTVNNKNSTEQDYKEVIQSNKIETGFYEAKEQKVYPYEFIKGSNNKNVKKFTSFKRGISYNSNLQDKSQGFIFQPPIEWMPDLWKGISLMRDWYDSFSTEVIEKSTEKSIADYTYKKNQLTSNLKKNGFNEEEINKILNNIESISGIENNYFEDSTGKITNINSSYKRANKYYYGHVQFEEHVNTIQMQKALTGIIESIEGLDANITLNQNIRDNPDSNKIEIYEAKENIIKSNRSRLELEEIKTAFNNKLFSENSTKIKQSNRIISIKDKAIFTDDTNRIKSMTVNFNLVDTSFRTIEKNKIKTSAVSILTQLDNPIITEYLSNELRNAFGGESAEAGIFGMDFSDENISKLANKFGLNTNWETVQNFGIFMKSFRTWNNIGMGTSVTNNFQRITRLFDIGWKKQQKVWSITNFTGKGKVPGYPFTKDEFFSMASELGIFEGGNSLIDMMSMGMNGADSTDWTEGLLPAVDVLKLIKADVYRKAFNSDSGWNKLIKNSIENPPENTERMNLAVDTVKQLIYKFYKSEKTIPKYDKNGKRITEEQYLKSLLKKMKVGFYKDYMNRLVKWKMTWVPVSGLENTLTLKGTEEQMRFETAVGVFIEAVENGSIQIPGGNQKWKYTDYPKLVKKARLAVYANLFGMSSPFLPKMFRGGTLGAFFQWKQFSYHQFQEDIKPWINAWNSSSQSNILIDGINFPIQFQIQIIKKMIRFDIPGFPNKKILKSMGIYDLVSKATQNPQMDKLVNVFLVRGISSLALSLLYMQPTLIFGLKFIQSFAKFASRSSGKIVGRGLSGVSGVLYPKIAGLIMGLLALAGHIKEDEKESNPYVEDLLRDFTAPELMSLYLLLSDYEENKKQQFKFFLPQPLKFGTDIPDLLKAVELID
tara:strand:- start:169 stop:3948 length:3780 start_codon:yes stop_codon:yes gene_type:complete